MWMRFTNQMLNNRNNWEHLRFVVKWWSRISFVKSCLSNVHNCLWDYLHLPTEIYTCFSWSCPLLYSNAFTQVYIEVGNIQEHSCMYSLMQSNTITLKYTLAWWNLQWPHMQRLWLNSVGFVETSVCSVDKQIFHPESYSLMVVSCRWLFEIFESS